MTKKKMDAAEVLAVLANIRARMPKPSKPVAKKKETSSRLPGNSVEDFENQAVIDALEDISAELGAALDEKRQKLHDQALEVYWTAEELSRDPAHAELIPHVEKMREAYMRDYGKPIPPRPTKK